MTLPARIAQWWPHIQDAARFQGLSAHLLAAVVDRESNGGEALLPKGNGAEGTGDWTPRAGAHFATSPRFSKVGTNAKGEALYMPADLLGWGRGLCQLDYGAHPELMAMRLPDGRDAWRDARTNIAMGAQILGHAAARFKRELLGCPDVEVPAVAAFNAGEGAVLRALDGLTRPIRLGGLIAALDEITTGHDYVSDVLRRRDAFAKPAPLPGAQPKEATS